MVSQVSSDYSTYFDKFSDPVELRLKFQNEYPNTRVKILISWNPEFLLINRPKLLKSVLEQYLHVDGDHDEEIYKWFCHYLKLFGMNGQEDLFDEYADTFLGMKKKRDEEKEQRKKRELEDFERERQNLPLGTCKGCGFNQTMPGDGGLWDTSHGGWYCHPCKNRLRIRLDPMACEWCSYDGVKWFQGNTYDCPRCNALGIGKSL